MEQLSNACLSIPAIVSSGYGPKGKWEQIGPLNTYVSAPANMTPTRGVIHIYDIFGISPQTLQGADRLAAHLNAIVLVPDFFQGATLPADLVPADTDEKKAKLHQFKKERADIPECLKLLKETTRGATGHFTSVTGWAVSGLCWGGKVAVLASKEGTKFKASAQAHPGGMAKEDAEAVAIPHLVLPSKDEPAEMIEAYEELLTGEGKTGEVELYPTMHHGWMGARANLENEENARGFERGYAQIASFFARHI